MPRIPSKGTLFLHRRFLDPSFVPGPGERYADAPKAVCRITAVTNGRVYYAVGADATKGQYYADYDKFISDVFTQEIV